MHIITEKNLFSAPNGLECKELGTYVRTYALCTYLPACVLRAWIRTCVCAHDIHTYIYTYPPAPFRGPPGCEGYVCNCCLRVLSVQQSAIVSLPVWYLLLAACRSADCVESNCYWTCERGCYHSPGCVVSTWRLPGYPWKSSTFKHVSKNLRNQKKSAQGHQNH